ncbi:MAG: hypothetical protein KDB46_04210 [Solirubrobacterales bacterium]|nr:hypothetical protein [Solirubrobacterales bacterium]
MNDRAEVYLGDYALILDGRVVEVLHRSGAGDRFHVNHVAVEAKPRRDGGMRIQVGIEAGGIVQQGQRFEVPAERVGEVTALFEQAKSRRTRSTGSGPPCG